MRVGIIDLGTNSARFDVHDLSGNRPRELHHEKLMIRLGQDVFKSGKLHPEAIRRAFKALADFQKTAALLEVTKVIAFGTSALRDARNSKEFIRRLKSELGIPLRIISGKREAELIALGILNNERVPRGNYALVDIGGGSTEISLCRGKRVLASHSFNLGTARLTQLFVKSSPPAPEQLSALRKHIRQTLARAPKLFRSALKPMPLVIGSSGTIRAVAKLVRKNLDSKSLDLTGIGALNALMSDLSKADLSLLRGMDEKRVDMILAGSILFEECLSYLDAERAIPTEFSLRDGMIAWVASSLQTTRTGESRNGTR